MAQYKYPQNLTQSTAAAFDTRYAPGTKIENPGIYRCVSCGEEILLHRRQKLPPQDHHAHNRGEGKIEWQLLVFAQLKS
jgi:hypothetical protein